MSGESKVAVTETHQLFRSWKLWYDSLSTFKVDWELSLVPIVTVKSVEDFCAMIHFMKPVHAMRTFSQFHFFQDGVKPMWEDRANKYGGKLWVNLENSQKNESLSETGKKMDSLWKSVLMALVGEVLEDPNSDAENDIMGVVFSKKKQYNRLAIWVRDAEKLDAIERIKKCLEELLSPEYKFTLTKHGER